MAKFALGAHLGSESVRVLVVDIKDGRIAGNAVERYVDPGKRDDWLSSLAAAAHAALREGGIDANAVIGIGLAGALLDRGNWIVDQLNARGTQLLYLPDGIAISPAAGEARASVPGAGVASPSTLVMLLSRAGRCLLNSRIAKVVPGVDGPIENGILPGYFAYEFEHSAQDGDRAAMESSAFSLRSIVETMRDAGVHVRRFVASGELSHSTRLMQIYADVLGEKIKLAQSDHPAALGAAILGSLAAGPQITGYAQMSQAIHAMARQRHPIAYRPDLAQRKAYEQAYQLRRGSGG